MQEVSIREPKDIGRNLTFGIIAEKPKHVGVIAGVVLRETGEEDCVADVGHQDSLELFVLPATPVELGPRLKGHGSCNPVVPAEKDEIRIIRVNKSLELIYIEELVRIEGFRAGQLIDRVLVFEQDQRSNQPGQVAQQRLRHHKADNRPLAHESLQVNFATLAFFKIRV